MTAEAPDDSDDLGDEVMACAARRVLPMLEPGPRRVIEDALERVRAGRTRVLLLGEAKRGKSSLVNVLAGTDLLPTGALPLTSVATVVRIGDHDEARCRGLDGVVCSLDPGEVADLVSERGNPGNRAGVDQVELTVAGGRLPSGTEIVDTPGTGSVHAGNTAEADRARDGLDIALLVVSVDPPLSRAELDLLVEAHGRAARSAVVVNKTDLVGADEVGEVVGFTRSVVAGELGELPVLPVLPVSARTGDGIDALVAWLHATIRDHGAADTRATARALVRRYARTARDAIRVERELARSDSDDAGGRAEALAVVLTRARNRTTAARDRIEGEARRLRRELDDDYAENVRSAVTAARTRADRAWRDAGEGPPEEVATTTRTGIADDTTAAVHRWFEARSERLRVALRAAAAATLRDLRDDLASARATAGELLALELADVEEPEVADPWEAPAFSPAAGPGWQELLTASAARRMPVGWRRRRLRRELVAWVTDVLPRPYGQARSVLAARLRSAAALLVGAVDDEAERRLSALQRGLAAVRDEHGRRVERDGGHEHELAAREHELDAAIALLD